MYSSSYQVPAVNINQSISPKAHFLGCFGMGTFIQSTSLKARFLEAAPSSGFKSYDLTIALFSFQRTPLLVILLQYCVASSSPSVNILFMYVSVRFVVAPCLATKSLRNNTNISAPHSRQNLIRVLTDFQALTSRVSLYNITLFKILVNIFFSFF